MEGHAMPEYQLAQLNIALLSAPLESPELADFVANLDRLNALAEHSPGFVWRLQSDNGDATAFRPFGEDYLVNLTLWVDIESLHDYVYRSAHAEIMSRRREWFKRLADAYTVLWWVPVGHRPTLAESRSRLETLRRKGPTPDAFTFKRPFAAPDSADCAASLAVLENSGPATWT
jgi:hypothetical protein